MRIFLVKIITVAVFYFLTLASTYGAEASSDDVEAIKKICRILFSELPPQDATELLADLQSDLIARSGSKPEPKTTPVAYVLAQWFSDNQTKLTLIQMLLMPVDKISSEPVKQILCRAGVESVGKLPYEKVLKLDAPNLGTRTAHALFRLKVKTLMDLLSLTPFDILLTPKAGPKIWEYLSSLIREHLGIAHNDVAVALRDFSPTFLKTHEALRKMDLNETFASLQDRLENELGVEWSQRIKEHMIARRLDKVGDMDFLEFYALNSNSEHPVFYEYIRNIIHLVMGKNCAAKGKPLQPIYLITLFYAQEISIQELQDMADRKNSLPE